jgi:hypothetical protein
MSNATITAPVLLPTHSNNSCIKIAVGRTSAGTDCDYVYLENVNITTTNPNLIVPFVGSMALPYTINGTNGSAVKGIQPITEIYCSVSGYTQVAFLDPAYPMPTQFPLGIWASNDINGNLTVLNWNFPYVEGQGRAATNSIVYMSSPITDAGTFAFFFQFTVPVTNAPASNNGVYTFSVSSTGNLFPSTNNTSIPNLQYWWHCLAAGTQVAMADGSQKSIEMLDNSHRVTSGSYGADLAVEATALGHHEASASQLGMQGIYRLRTADGKELIATGAHPIMTPAGALMVCHLNVGDRVLVTEGVSTVASCDAIDHSGMFYDLKLGNAEDRAKTGQHPVCTYHANGILVGDHAAMNAQFDRQRYDLDFILPRIGANLRTDYANAVQDRS